jgi:hypothetical protein
MRASFKSAEIVHGDWKKAIIVRGKRMRSLRPPHEGEIAMASLMDSRTDQNLRHTFSDGGRFNRLSASRVRAAAMKDLRLRPSRTRFKTGDLDFLVLGYDTSSPLGRMATEQAMAIAATYDHTAMHAEMARVASEECFEEIADWRKTLATAGRSDVLENLR